MWSWDHMGASSALFKITHDCQEDLVILVSSGCQSTDPGPDPRCLYSGSEAAQGWFPWRVTMASVCPHLLFPCTQPLLTEMLPLGRGPPTWAPVTSIASLEVLSPNTASPASAALSMEAQWVCNCLCALNFSVAFLTVPVSCSTGNRMTLRPRRAGGAA